VVGHLVRELPYGNFTRQVFLGGNLDTSNIEAEYDSCESARESWRLLPLRGWSNAKEIPLPPGGA